jgi:hypothetical protein
LGKHQEHKINIKARIDRHSRVIKDNLIFKNKIFSLIRKNKFIANIIAIILLFLMPVYPMFAGIVHNSNEYNYYREIDEDSIIASFEEDPISELSNGEIIESNDEFVIDN